MHTLQKKICYLTSVLLIRIAIVDMVLWDDTYQNSTLIVRVIYWQCSAHGVATGATEYATMAWSLQMSDKCYMKQKGIVPLQ